MVSIKVNKNEIHCDICNHIIFNTNRSQCSRCKKDLCERHQIYVAFKTINDSYEFKYQLCEDCKKETIAFFHKGV